MTAGTTGTESRALLTFADAAAAARNRLAPQIWDFIAGGSGSETTLAGNREALDRLWLVPRALAGLKDADPTGTLLGCPVGMPVAVAPMAYQRLCHPDGEIALARACRTGRTVFVASIFGSTTIEEVAATGADTWFQLYWLRDRGRTAELIGRAERSGCRALMVTVDVPRMGRRLRDMRNGFTLPPDVVAANLDDGAGSSAHRQVPGDSAAIVHTTDVVAPDFGWSDLAWVRAQTRLPLVIKGVLHPDDAARAADAGVDAVVVSNHGGRQLDGAVPSVEALPGVVRAVPDSCSVLFDSGVRSGTDVLKALALGADGVLLGRPALWGLAAGGETGAARMLTLLREELTDAMLLAGVPDVASARHLVTTTRGQR